MASRAHDQRLQRRLEAELARRTKKPWDARAYLARNPQQLAVHDDPSRDRIFTGTRQLGKSRFAAVEFIDAHCHDVEAMDSVFLDFDKEHADKVILADFQELIDEFDIPNSPRVVNERLEFSNGSKVYVFSGKPSEVKKIQGLKYRLFIPDECQDAEKLAEIFKLARPALMRNRGRIVAMGIPGRVAGIGFWWDITNGKLAHLYGQHRGHYRDNPFLPPEEMILQREKAAAEQGEESSDFRRHWDGVWPELDDELRVYKYNPDVNGYGDPDDPKAAAEPPCKIDRHALGLDPGGVQDEEAAVMLGHSLGGGQCAVVDEDGSGKGKGGDWDDTELRLGPFYRKWNPLDAFYDYGSAKKAAKLTLEGDARVRIEAVPMKDLDIEIPRINKLFKQKRIWIRRGSRLEKDLLYTCWDAKARAEGKNDYSRAWKQNFADAFRAAMWAFEGYKNPEPDEESPRERRQREIREMIERNAPDGYNALVDAGCDPLGNDLGDY